MNSYKEVKQGEARPEYWPSKKIDMYLFELTYCDLVQVGLGMAVLITICAVIWITTDDLLVHGRS